MSLGQPKNEPRCAPRDDSIVVDLMKIAPLTAHDEAQALVERSLGALFELCLEALPIACSMTANP